MSDNNNINSITQIASTDSLKAFTHQDSLLNHISRQIDKLVDSKDHLTDIPEGLVTIFNNRLLSVIIAIVAVIFVWLVVYVLKTLKKGKKLDKQTEIPSITKYLSYYMLNHSLHIVVIIGLVTILYAFDIGILTLISILGFGVSFIGGYYSHSAKVASDNSLSEIKKTTSTILRFSNSLPETIVQVEQYIKDEVGKGNKISIKIVSVIPALGSVGLEQIPKNREEVFAYNLVKFCKVHECNVEILTHSAKKAQEWLNNIYSIEGNAGTKGSNTENERKKVDLVKVKEAVEFQRQFLTYCVDEGSSNVLVRFWDGSRFAPTIDYNVANIPFQFILINDYIDLPSPIDQWSISEYKDNYKKLRAKCIYFINSGDFLYEFVFKVLKQKYNMSTLSQFTKGYYSHDEEMLSIFNSIYSGFASEMDILTQRNYAQYNKEFLEVINQISAQERNL